LKPSINGTSTGSVFVTGINRALTVDCPDGMFNSPKSARDCSAALNKLLEQVFQPGRRDIPAISLLDEAAPAQT
jgi:hypothetical protein